MNDITITIGIPTYNRADTIADVLNRAVADGINLMPGIDILVIDDDSPDDTYSRLLSISEKHQNIHVLKNDQRLGFQGNFVNVIRTCRSDYVVISADDDFLVGDGIGRLRNAIAALPQPPALISSVFYKDGAVERGQDDAVRRIELPEFRNCCAHLPGIVLNTAQAKQGCDVLGPMLFDPDNYYPQCCLAFLFLSYRLPCFYLPLELSRTGWDRESGIARYATVEGRWKQYQFFVSFMGAVAAALQKEGQQEKFDLAMRQLESEKHALFNLIGFGIRNERPEFASYFLAGALEFANSNKNTQ